jgi:2-oxoglutarate ferredoxin oxidoreductase subunit delta
MAGKIQIDIERCKGCGLCVAVCPKKTIGISKRPNKKGFFPIEVVNGDCIGCAACSIVCPDVAIVVFRDANIAADEPKSKKKEVNTLKGGQAR